MSLEYLRLLIPDTEKDEDDNYIFTDDQLNTYLENTRNVWFAAADALRAIASNEALITKWLRTDDMQVDGPAVAKELRLLALEHENRGKSEVALADDGYAIAITYPPKQTWRIPEGTQPWCR